MLSIRFLSCSPLIFATLARYPWGIGIPYPIIELTKQNNPVIKKSERNAKRFGFLPLDLRNITTERVGIVIERQQGIAKGKTLIYSAKTAPAATPAANIIPIPTISPESFIASFLIFVKIAINFLSLSF